MEVPRHLLDDEEEDGDACVGEGAQRVRENGMQSVQNGHCAEGSQNIFPEEMVRTLGAVVALLPPILFLFLFFLFCMFFSLLSFQCRASTVVVRNIPLNLFL